MQPALLSWVSFAGALRGEIVGGHEAQPHSHPYMAYLKIVEHGYCGGFLVAPDWVMSAAHCLGNTTVILGAHDITEPEKSQQVRGVLKYYEHPEYNPITYANDILLLQLTSKATLNEYVQPIPLPRTGSDLPTGTKCMIAGWGLIDQDRDTSKLFETQVSIYSRRKCSLFYPQLNSEKKSVVSKITFISLQGDSGGPLVCNNVAQGVVSFGYDSPPGVYARISNYLPWIRRVMNK
uniref:Peptidase S1 domain-containing protein n=1 Tax=Zonotrichia albicollis TaxID=44394 RepID=A0A8D2NEE4_ZONAL